MLPVYFRCVFKPIGRWFGLRPRSQLPTFGKEKDFVLEKAFQSGMGHKGAQFKIPAEIVSLFCTILIIEYKYSLQK